MSQTPVQGVEEVRNLMFDRNGMMWVGTDQGVRTFDGYRFKAYRNDAYSPGILPNNYVLKITETPDGKLWFGTYDGLACFNRRKGTFKSYHLQSQNTRTIDALFTSSDGTVWVGTANGVSRYDAKNDEFIDIGMSTGVRSFTEDKKGNIFIGTWEGGLFRLNPKSGKLVPYPQLSERNTVQSQLMDSRGRLWIGTWEGGIVRLDHPDNEVNPGIHRINEGRRDFRTFHQLVEDSVSNAVWGCCIEGLTSVDLDDERIVENHSELNFCYDIDTDGHGNLWVLTRNQGIVHLSTQSSPFHFYHLDTAGLELPVNRIQTIHTSDGNLFWLGLQPYGLALYDRKASRVSYNNQIPGMQQMTGSSGIDVQTVSAFIQRSDHELWMGSSRGIVVWRSGEPARLLPRQRTPFIGEGIVNAFCQLHDGSLLVGQSADLAVAFSETEGRLLVSNVDVRNIIEDHNHRVWIATDNSGIMCVTGDLHNPKSIQYQQYAPVNGKYPLKDATAVYEDPHHRLWAISNEGALFGYDATKDKFVVENPSYHLNVNRIYAIDGDEMGRLWLSTDRGLVCLMIDDKGKCHPACYGVEDGIESTRFSANGLSRYGKEFFIGTANGFFSFLPGKMDQWQPSYTASLFVSELLIDDRPYERLDSVMRSRISVESPSTTRQITIPAGIEKFTVGFALLTYQNAQQCHYAYCLEGYDHQWHYVDADNRRATYQNLPAGSYTLRLMALDSYGHKSDLPYTISVKVLPPWYLSWWAYLVYVALAVAVAYGMICWYKNYLKTKNRLAMGVVFTNITHELLTPLTIISASIDELRQKAPQFGTNYGLMQNNIQRLTRLLRQILEVRKSQAGQLKLLVSRGDLSHFIARECDNIRPMAGANNGELFVNCPAEGVDAWFDKDKIDKILYNLLSNAVKYNKEGGRIIVTLTADRQHAVLKVSDEGIGMSRDKLKHLYTRFLDGDYRKMNTLGTGIGLSLTHDLVVLHHGRIDCQSQEGTGTTFTVTLPISKDAYTAEEIDMTADNKAIDDRQIEQVEDAVVDTTAEEVESYADEPSEMEYAVLIVEDNHELLGLMQKLFSQRYRVYTARNGQQALNIIYRRELDIVITDVMMPVMDGIELTRTIKDSDDYAQLPVVMLTAKTTEEEQNIGYETGADAYITKPFRMGDLQLRIDNIIKNRERIRRKFSSQQEFRVEEQHYSSPDEIFIQKAVDCVKANLMDGDYDRDRFACDMLVSSSTLYNKLRALTGQNVTGFINSIRLKEACRISRQHPSMNVNELSMAVGFNTPKYFAKCFKKEFGELPSEYIEKVRAGDYFEQRSV